MLVAIGLTSYREAIAAALREMCPGIEVFEGEAEDLDLGVRRLLPDVVVCSESTKLVRDRIPVWIELYPGCASHSFVSIRGEDAVVEDMQLSDIVSAAKQATDPA